MPFSVAILTVSDTAYTKGPEYDLSGPALRLNVEQNHAYALADTAIVPDDIALIREKVGEWVGRRGKDKVDWVITTGGEGLELCCQDFRADDRSLGTGFGERDVTPQVGLSG
jgi:molybdopterin biosynthesis enzyme MoaB